MATSARKSVDGAPRIETCLAQFEVSAPCGPLSSPERLLAAVRQELLPALSDALDDGTWEDIPLYAPHIEIDIGDWPDDPVWSDIRYVLVTKLRAALEGYAVSNTEPLDVSRREKTADTASAVASDDPARGRTVKAATQLSDDTRRSGTVTSDPSFAAPPGFARFLAWMEQQDTEPSVDTILVHLKENPDEQSSFLDWYRTSPAERVALGSLTSKQTNILKEVLLRLSESQSAPQNLDLSSTSTDRPTAVREDSRKNAKGNAATGSDEAANPPHAEAFDTVAKEALAQWLTESRFELSAPKLLAYLSDRPAARAVLLRWFAAPQHQRDAILTVRKKNVALLERIAHDIVLKQKNSYEAQPDTPKPRRDTHSLNHGSVAKVQSGVSQNPESILVRPDQINTPLTIPHGMDAESPQPHPPEISDAVNTGDWDARSDAALSQLIRSLRQTGLDKEAAEAQGRRLLQLLTTASERALQRGGPGVPGQLPSSYDARDTSATVSAETAAAQSTRAAAAAQTGAKAARTSTAPEPRVSKGHMARLAEHLGNTSGVAPNAVVLAHFAKTPAKTYAAAQAIEALDALAALFALPEMDPVCHSVMLALSAEALKTLYRRNAHALQEGLHRLSPQAAHDVALHLTPPDAELLRENIDALSAAAHASSDAFAQVALGLLADTPLDFDALRQDRIAPSTEDRSAFYPSHDKHPAESKEADAEPSSAPPPLETMLALAGFSESEIVYLTGEPKGSQATETQETSGIGAPPAVATRETTETEEPVTAAHRETSETQNVDAVKQSGSAEAEDKGAPTQNARASVPPDAKSVAQNDRPPSPDPKGSDPAAGDANATARARKRQVSEDQARVDMANTSPTDQASDSAPASTNEMPASQAAQRGTDANLSARLEALIAADTRNHVPSKDALRLVLKAWPSGDPDRPEQAPMPLRALIARLDQIVNPTADTTALSAVLDRAAIILEPDDTARGLALRVVAARLSSLSSLTGHEPQDPTGLQAATRAAVARVLDPPVNAPVDPHPQPTTAVTPAQPDDDTLLISETAGLVLLHPFFALLFERLKIETVNKALDPAAVPRALGALQFLAGTESSIDPLHRVLLGLDASLPLPDPEEPEADERDLMEGLLRSVIDRWGRIGSTSSDGLRQTFLQRTGTLRFDEKGAHLRVVPGPFDMLLDGLPWSLGPVSLPWMPRPCHVTWREDSDA